MENYILHILFHIKHTYKNKNKHKELIKDTVEHSFLYIVDSATKEVTNYFGIKNQHINYFHKIINYIYEANIELFETNKNILFNLYDLEKNKKLNNLEIIEKTIRHIL